MAGRASDWAGLLQMWLTGSDSKIGLVRPLMGLGDHGETRMLHFRGKHQMEE